MFIGIDNILTLSCIHVVNPVTSSVDLEYVLTQLTFK